MRKVFVCTLLLASLPALAGVYRWTDDKGVVHYSDAPPNPSAKPAELPPLQTFDSKSLAKGTPVSGSVGTSPDNTASAGPASSAAAATKPIITSPENEATIRDTSGQITVSVNVTDGASLIYYLDGVAQNAPATPSTSFLIENVERGTHTLEVAAVSGGKETARSDKVTIHYMPPTASMSKKKG